MDYPHAVSLPPDIGSCLTPAERAVVQLLLTGCRNREIAFARGSTVATVKHQLFHVYQKLGISSRSRLMAYAVSTALNCPRLPPR